MRDALPLSSCLPKTNLLVQLLKGHLLETNHHGLPDLVVVTLEQGEEDGLTVAAVEIGCELGAARRTLNLDVVVCALAVVGEDPDNRNEKVEHLLRPDLGQLDPLVVSVRTRPREHAHRAVPARLWVEVLQQRGDILQDVADFLFERCLGHC